MYCFHYTVNKHNFTIEWKESVSEFSVFMQLTLPYTLLHTLHKLFPIFCLSLTRSHTDSFTHMCIIIHHSLSPKSSRPSSLSLILHTQTPPLLHSHPPPAPTHTRTHPPDPSFTTHTITNQTQIFKKKIINNLTCKGSDHDHLSHTK